METRSPEAYPRRILLAVTGLSPQVVTETLYALAVAREPAFVPTEVHLVTTSEGAERARLSLLHEESGWFHKLCDEYGLRGIRFDEGTIHVLENGGDGPLADIRLPAHNELAADLITTTVRDLTADEESAVHVSIAGGRKTMGFYAGYALSLYGREQDRLSHVLVSAPYESHPDFYYPSKESRVIYTPGPDSRPLDTREAEVTLAEIPFVRMRHGLPEPLREGRAVFSEVVAEAQKALPPVALTLEPETRTVTAGGETFELKPAEFAFYWMVAERCRRGKPGVHWSEEIEQELLGHYGRLVKEFSGLYEEAERALSRGMDKGYFEPRKTKVNQAIRKALGERRAKPYLVERLERIPGTRYHRFGLGLPPERISIISGQSA